MVIGSKHIPGLIAAIVIAVVAQGVSGALGAALLSLQGIEGGSSPVSAVAVAVVLGLVVANTVGTPETLNDGLQFAVKKVLKFGIVLVGLKLSIVDVLQTGAIGIPVVLALIMLAMTVSMLFARLLGVSQKLGALAAVSTAICGITATLAVAPAIDADEKEVAYTVANVTLLGLFGMLVYPYVANAIFADASSSVGLFLGTVIHDTSQVMGAALTYAEVFGDSEAMEVATITKLTRNLFLVVVIPFMGWWFGERKEGETASLWKHVPGFVLAFAVMAVVRTVGDMSLEATGAAFGMLDSETWAGGLTMLGKTVSVFCLAVALAAVGLRTRLAVIAELGARPLVVGVAAAAVVTLASMAIAVGVMVVG
ncbi:MAG: YeiH family protein [Myxococcota bacterium]